MALDNSRRQNPPCVKKEDVAAELPILRLEDTQNFLTVTYLLREMWDSHKAPLIRSKSNAKVVQWADSAAWQE